MCKQNESISDEDIIILLRADIKIKKINFNNINNKLKKMIFVCGRKREKEVLQTTIFV